MSYRPSKSFRVGSMRDRITVKQPTETLDTAGQPVVSWTNFLVSEPAAYEYVSGTERNRGGQVEAGVNAVFTVHYRSGYTPRMKIVFGGVDYGIVHVVPVHGKTRYLEIHCKAVL